MHKNLLLIISLVWTSSIIDSHPAQLLKSQKVVGTIQDQGKILTLKEEDLKKMGRGNRNKVSGDCTIRCTNKLRKVTLNRNFTSYSSTDLSEVTVKGVLTMYGALHAQNCLFNEVDIRCRSDEDSDAIYQMISCEINKLLVVETDGVELLNSQVGSITIATEPHKKSSITLTNTTVTGPIYFTQKGGTVFGNDSMLIQGPIINGTFEKIS